MGRRIAEEYAEGLAAMAMFHSPAILRRAAEEVLERLPGGPVSIVSTSIEGAALAAVCSILAEQQVSGWHMIDIAFPLRAELEKQVVVVEPIDPGAGWRNLLLKRLPGAQIVIPVPEDLTEAAS
jgi:hypothetical protein